VARYLALGIAVVGLIYSGWLLVLAVFLLFMSMAEEGAARARMYMGDPGYQDAPTVGQGAYNPFVSFAEKSGFKVQGSEWEVLPPEDVPVGSPAGTSRAYRDQKGNTIFVTWKNGR
jgi:hypothetical protein